MACVFSFTNWLEPDLCKKVVATFQKKYSESKVTTGNRYKSEREKKREVFTYFATTY